MAIRAKVVSVPTTRISINSQQKSVVRTVSIGTGGSGVNTLEELLDVDASDPDTNETLVYDEASGKYIVKTLPIINGGTF